MLDSEMARSIRPLIFSSVAAVTIHPTASPAFRHSASIVHTTITSMVEPESSKSCRLLLDKRPPRRAACELCRFPEAMKPYFKFRRSLGNVLVGTSIAMPSGLNAFLGVHTISPDPSIPGEIIQISPPTRMEPKIPSFPLCSRRTKLASSASPSQIPYHVFSRINEFLQRTSLPPSFTAISMELSAFKSRFFELKRHFVRFPSKLQLVALVIVGVVALPRSTLCTIPKKAAYR